jgi:ferredoxin
MKVRVESAKCTGHGRCYELAPEIFEEDERGHCHIPNPIVPAGLEAKARLAQMNCAEDAITLEES